MTLKAKQGSSRGGSVVERKTLRRKLDTCVSKDSGFQKLKLQRSPKSRQLTGKNSSKSNSIKNNPDFTRGYFLLTILFSRPNPIWHLRFFLEASGTSLHLAILPRKFPFLSHL